MLNYQHLQLRLCETIMRHVGVEPTSQEPESCVLSITLAAQAQYNFSSS